MADDFEELESLLMGLKGVEKKLAELEGKHTVWLIPQEKINRFAPEIVKAAAQANSDAILLSTHSPQPAAASVAASAPAKTKTVFIDCVSSNKPITFDREKNCVYVSGPTNLTGLSTAVSMALQATCRHPVFVFDSVSHFASVNDAEDAAKFFRHLVMKLSSKVCTGVFLCAAEQAEAPQVAQVLAPFGQRIRF